ncbi:MAG: hypothetical protein M9894_04775 [Planctomycetes bacterium]|nr:hypothetical protein [Planctomycetota bacterium]
MASPTPAAPAKGTPLKRARLLVRVVTPTGFAVPGFGLEVWSVAGGLKTGKWKDGWKVTTDKKGVHDFGEIAIPANGMWHIKGGKYGFGRDVDDPAWTEGEVTMDVTPTPGKAHDVKLLVRGWADCVVQVKTPGGKPVDDVEVELWALALQKGVKKGVVHLGRREVVYGDPWQRRPWYVKVRKPGWGRPTATAGEFAPGEVMVEYPVKPDEKAVILVPLATDRADLTVTVKNAADGKPLPGASVEVWALANGIGTPGERLTDAKGQLRFEDLALRAGPKSENRWVVKVAKKGFGPPPKKPGDEVPASPVERTVDGPAPGQHRTLEVKLAPDAAELAVTVTDAGGKPLAEAEVEVVGKHLAKTDKTGKVVIPALALGTWSLKVRLAGWGPVPTGGKPFLAGEHAQQLVHAKAQALTVKLMQGKASFAWPTPAAGAAHVQWVNLAADPARRELGSVCKLKVRLDGGPAGAPVYVRTRYEPAKVSPRSSHVRGLRAPDAPLPAWAGPAPATGKKVAVAAVGSHFEADVEVECGLAGLDELTVEVGATEACKDAKLVIKNMRRVKLEEIKPVAAISSYAGAGVNPGTTALLRARFAPVGVDFEVARTATYALSDLVPQNVVDGPYVGLPAGKKLVFVTDTTADAVRIAKSTQGAVRDTQTIAWFDTIVETREAGPGGTDLLRSAVLPEKWLGTGAMEKTQMVPAPFRCFPHDWENPSRPSVTEIKWRAHSYKDASGTWKPVATGTPGAAKKDWQTVSVATAADVAKYVTFVDWTTIRIKLPTADAADAGNFVTDGGAQVSIGVQIKLHLCSVDTLASALRGDITMSTASGTATDPGSAEVILHEIGHNMGQSVVDRSQPGATQTILSTGRSVNFGRSTAVPGLTFAKPPSHSTAFPAIVPAGFMYTGKEHQGPHCARGLTAAQRAQTSYGGLPGTCLMFGETDMARTSARTYCPECERLIRGEDLADFRRAWAV